MKRHLARLSTVLPAGTGTVGIWLAFSGALAYAFLAISGRAIGADDASGLSTLWVVGFLVGNAAGLPVEQEVSRAVATRRAQGLGTGPVIRRAALAAGGFALVVVVVLFGASPWIVDRLFGGDWTLLVALAVLFVGTIAEFLVRGVLAGSQNFGAYGRLLGAESGIRVLVVIVLAVSGVHTSGPYGIALALAPFVGIGVSLIGVDRADLDHPGPPSPWGELTRALGWLLAGSTLAQGLVNLAPVFVRLLAPHAEDLTSAFVASLIVARVPVFLFQAAQAALLPRLAHHVGGGRAATLAAETRALARAVCGLVVVAAVGAGLLGPTVVRIGWGRDFALGSGDFAALAAASCVYLLAVTFAQALVALEIPHRVAYSWGAGLVTLLGVIAVGDDVLTRVEMGFFAGSVVAAAAMGLSVVGPLRRAVAHAWVPDPAEEPH
ncbi:MAG: hypothetical protein ABIP21_12315 [Acidimicrobiia bacterium]